MTSLSTASTPAEVKAKPTAQPKAGEREFVAAAFKKVLEKAVKLGLATSQPQADGSLLINFAASHKAEASTKESI